MTETEQMMMHLLNCNRIDLYVDAKEMNAQQKQNFDAMVQRRLQGEPLQYIIGQCEFMGLRFLVDERVLIPRPETELLVEKALLKAESLKSAGKLSILDLGTGSGNIAVSLAKLLKESFVTTVDVSAEALEVAKQNAEIHGVKQRVKFVHSDMEKYLNRLLVDGGKFDMIISNPPYIRNSDMLRLPIDVRKEPRIALDGGDDGLDFYRVIAQLSAGLLKEEGTILVEIGDTQRQGLVDIFSKLYCIEFFKDYAQTDRILTGELK